MILFDYEREQRKRICVDLLFVALTLVVMIWSAIGLYYLWKEIVS